MQTRPDRALDHDDGTPSWGDTGRQELQGPGARHWEVGRQRGTRSTNEVASAAGCRQHEDHPIDPAVSRLERKPSKQGLDVPRGGLDLDAEPSGRRTRHRSPADHGIPRSLIAGDRECDLDRPPDRPVEDLTKAPEDLRLPIVADR